MMEIFRFAVAAAGIALFAPLLGACAPQPDATASAQQSGSSILVGSTPAAGSTVSAPVDQLILRFSPPAVLNEVTVDGPEGTMPTMISPVGESDHYSIPLPGLGAGTYAVRWRATAAGKAHEGSFSFSVR